MPQIHKFPVFNYSFVMKKKIKGWLLVFYVLMWVLLVGCVFGSATFLLSIFLPVSEKPIQLKFDLLLFFSLYSFFTYKIINEIHRAKGGGSEKIRFYLKILFLVTIIDFGIEYVMYTNKYIQNDPGSLAGPIIWVTTWNWYFRKSKRVKDYFEADPKINFGVQSQDNI